MKPSLALALLFSFLFALLPHGFEIRQYFKHWGPFFVDDKPLIQNPDGYYFGRLAREWSDGNSIQEDSLRNFPEGGVKYKYTPLISVIYGSLIKLTGLPLEWVGFWFSPILGSLFVIPLILFWHFAGNLWVGLGSAIITALSSAYLTRVFVLDIDTDSLNLFFIFCVALFLLLSYKNRESWRSYVYYLFALIFSFLFFWWYAHPEFFTLSFVGFWLLTFRQKGLFYFSLFGFGALWLFISYLVGFPVGLDIFHRLFLYLGLKLPTVETQSVPEVVKTITEQSKIYFFRTHLLFFSSEIPFYIALLSFPILFIRYLKTNLLLLPLFILLLFAVWKGNNRLYLYISPLLSASFVYGAHLISRLKNVLEKESLRFFVGHVFPFMMVLIGINWLSLLDRSPGYFISKEVVQDLKKLKELTPEDAKILTWWDYGYAIAYYSNRAVFHDGGSQFFIKTPLIAYGFMSEEEKAHKIFSCVSDPFFNLKTYQLAKEKGLFGALESSLEHCQKAPYPKTYLLITEDVLGKAGAISYLAFGKTHPLLRLPECAPLDCRETFEEDKGLYVQDFNGSITEYHTKEVVVVDKGRVEKNIFNGPKGTLYLVRKDGRSYGFLVSERVKHSSLITLYTIRQDRNGFRLVYDNFPHAVLYEIISHKQPRSLK